MEDTDKTLKIAIQSHQAGELQQAEQLYRQVIQNEPGQPIALHLSGIIAHQRGLHDTAADLVAQAIASNPQIPQFYNTQGLVFEALGKIDEAILAYEKAISLNPDYAEAYLNIAIALQSNGDYAAAVEKCEQSLSIAPDSAQTYNTMGYSLQQQGKFTEAIESYRQALRLKPDYAEACNHLGVVLDAQGRYARAIDNYTRAIQFDSDYAEAHWNLSLVLLKTGELVRGWKEYQWRNHPELDMFLYPYRYDQLCWDGSSFRGKRLLLHYEQGLGDSLNFIRYLPMVKARGGTTIVEVRKPLYNLLRGFAGIDELLEASIDKRPAVDFDFHTSLVDLPRIFGTTMETIPADIPYITPDQAKVKYWSKRISEDTFNVGIVWSGSETYERNQVRSCRLEHFTRLASIKDIKLYGLQKGAAVAQIEQLAGKLSIVNLVDQFHDFTDTAAVIQNLDLVISVDTSVLHLAGAMGKPVWALLCNSSEWRWMLERQDSPWYPTMRLFRQKEAGRWDEVFDRVASQLQIFSKPATAAVNQPRSNSAQAITPPENFGLQDRTRMAEIAEVMETAAQNHQEGRLDEAGESYRLVLKTEPDHPGALYGLGTIASQTGRHDLAIELVGKAIEEMPEIPQFYNTFGIALVATGKLEKAIEAYQQAVSLKPDYAEVYNNMATALQRQNKYADSIDNCKQAISLKPDYAVAYGTMAFSLEKQNRYAEAIKCYEQAIELEPDRPSFHLSLGMILLLTGKFKQGWQEYEWRLDDRINTYPHRLDVPRWDCSSFEGKRLFVHCEQGFGDKIQFVRYLPMLKERGGAIIFEAEEKLLSLFQGFKGIDELVEVSAASKAAVKCDFYVPMMSLPGIFATTAETIPADVPYIHADPTMAEYWRNRLSGPGFKVGIVWAGIPGHQNDLNRSCSLDHFGPLSKIDSIKLYGLQRGKAAEQTTQLSEQIQITNIAEELNNFADTAAAIENLDLVISVDTAVLHLAGAMGKPVWALLPFAPDWRWMLERDDSPWYPTMRLFRQKEPRRWDCVFESVQEQLHALIGGQAHGTTVR